MNVKNSKTLIIVQNLPLVIINGKKCHNDNNNNKNNNYNIKFINKND